MCKNSITEVSSEPSQIICDPVIMDADAPPSQKDVSKVLNVESASVCNSVPSICKNHEENVIIILLLDTKILEL